MHKLTLLLPSFKRPHLLKLGLSSIRKQRPSCELEILVMNDYLPDGTEEVCDSFKDLNVRYIFTGKRNLNGSIKKRVPGFALNIGIKESSGDVIVLSCPEMYHLNHAIDILYSRSLQSKDSIVIPHFIYFDKTNETTSGLVNDEVTYRLDLNKLVGGNYGRCHVEMPFLMAIHKHHLVEIGGYDEDFTGYAGEDNDIMERLKQKGLTYFRTGAEAIHLWHEGAGDGGFHFENPDWVHNYNILKCRKGIMIRNVGREWGVNDDKKT